MSNLSEPRRCRQGANVSSPNVSSMGTTIYTSTDLYKQPARVGRES